jgi:hypothetical protein
MRFNSPTRGPSSCIRAASRRQRSAPHPTGRPNQAGHEEDAGARGDFTRVHVEVARTRLTSHEPIVG